MRVGKHKGAEEYLENSSHYVILGPGETKGRWREVFGNGNLTHIEVDSGEGAFTTGMALQNPDINYIGVDIQVPVLSYALDKVLGSQAPNVRLLLVDGSDLTGYFADGEIDLVYLNFLGPWSEKRHEERRLIYKTFLDIYRQILPEQDEIHLKTDNRGLFEYSLASLLQYNMILKQVWLDLHISDLERNVMTEYEGKLSQKG